MIHIKLICWLSFTLFNLLFLVVQLGIMFVSFRNGGTKEILKALLPNVRVVSFFKEIKQGKWVESNPNFLTKTFHPK